MNTSTFEAFQADSLAAGFNEVLERRWAPDTVIATHAHAFGVEAVVRHGEMWLHFEGNTLHLMPGDGFTLSAGLPHDERYGAERATYWVARRNAARCKQSVCTSRSPSEHAEPAHPAINSLLSLEALTRLRSVTKAAKELSVRPSAVSHRIRRLKAHLSQRLSRAAISAR